MVDGRPMSITSFRSGSVRSQVEPLTELENSSTSPKTSSASAYSEKKSSNHSIISVSRHVEEKSTVRKNKQKNYRNFESFIVSIFLEEENNFK